jgi:hypothetical protein
VAGCSARAAVAAEEFEPGSVPMKAEQVAPHSWYVHGQTGLVSSRQRGLQRERRPRRHLPTASSSSMRSARRRSASASPT